MTCPYRIAPEHGCTPSAVASDGVLSAMRKREHDGRCVALKVNLTWQGWCLFHVPVSFEATRPRVEIYNRCGGHFG